MRPRLEIELAPGERAPLLAQMIEELRDPDCPAQGRVRGDVVELTTCARKCHVWSPRLTLHVEASDAGGALLRGRFSPHPNVWTGFMALYGTLGLLGTFGLMFGISQWWLDMTPWGLLAVPLSLLLMAFAYGAAFIGQGLGADEMYMLRSFLDGALRAIRRNA